MDIGEQYSRCKATRRVIGRTADKRTIMCKVFGRTVQDCSDCAFSVFQRPAYLERKHGGLVEDATTISGWRSICNAPPDHLKENQWKRAEGAVLPEQHCHNKEDATTC